jgi:cytochrome c oxidase subunit II
MKRATLLACGLVSGCVHSLPVLQPAGPSAQRIAELIHLFTLICAAVWLAVVAMLLIAALRRRTTAQDPASAPDRARERALHVSVGIATALTVAIIVGLNLASFRADRGLDEVARDPALTIQVTGQQWWWKLVYEDARPDRVITAANELHIPVGVPVKLKLRSSDVIHSFWVPELGGKRDLIPGRENDLVLQADRAGTFEGQCAEFCGLQHARMRLLVIAQPQAEFDAWREQQLQAAAPPTDAQRERGLQVFLSQPCVSCHTVRGTGAGGRMAPDLTHVASQRTLAAGTLLNTRDNLAAWIAGPQAVKPGAKMPTMQIPPDDLAALVDYLQGLQ